MHEVSEQTIETVKKHIPQMLEHSQKIQDLGKSLQDDETKQELGRRIEAYGNTMYEHAQKCQDLLHKLIENNSTEIFSQAIEEHVKLNQLHIKAIQEVNEISPPS